MPPVTGLYAEGYSSSAFIDQYANDIKNSGFNRLIIGLLHIGNPKNKGQAYGDILLNSGDNDLIIHEGSLNPANSAWPKQIDNILAAPTNVTSVYFSIGGASKWVFDFRTMQTIIGDERSNGITNSPNNPDSILFRNFAALKQNFPMVEGIDLDNEELTANGTDNWLTLAFVQMLSTIGFKVSFCPFTDADFWIACLQELNKSNPGSVTGFNLQCYAGGGLNADPEIMTTEWIQPLQQAMGKDFNASAFISAGLWCRVYSTDPQDPGWEYGTLCPDQVYSQWQQWQSLSLGGGFIWVYDDLQNSHKYPGSGCSGSMQTADYANAVKKGLGQ